MNLSIKLPAARHADEIPGGSSVISTHETDRQEWSRLQGDEDAALRKQQKAAGPTHSPVLGPGPHGAHGTNIAVEASVASERDRCAKVAELWAVDQPHEVQSLLRRLAAAMRAG
jgi:hypothetical protein